MSKPIEDYAVIGNTHTVALIARDGSMDWLCLPRFDSAACFAALLGNEENGRWIIRPAQPVKDCRRFYHDQSLILETRFRTESGEVALIDFMPAPKDETAEQVIRIVQGIDGVVEMETEAVFRFDYGHIVPWVQKTRDGLSAIAGPEAIHLHCMPQIHGEDFRSRARFTVRAGETTPFCMVWHVSHLPPPRPGDPLQALQAARQWWDTWSGHCTYDGLWSQEVRRSLLVLKALTYGPTGGIVAAPTTSLPEKLGGVRNWDYRYCWLRDATFTLYALLNSGYRSEARAWREWLIRAVAGRPSQLQVMYGIAGERRLDELDLPWLSGYEGSRPVRTGNQAYRQLQIDIFGEVVDAFYAARKHKVEPNDAAWQVQKVMLDALETRWDEPDEGIWEIRGPRRSFTHSRVMAWVALDRAIKSIEHHGLDGPLENWKALRKRIHEDVCTNGYDSRRNTFVQFYGGKQVDAALLLIPQVGFLPHDDERVRGTVEAIDRELNQDGFIMRYPPDTPVDGLPPGEGAFLACSFWMVDALIMLGREEEARERFERLIGLANDVGLLPEEYDPTTRRFLGNFPQAFSHVGLINSAYNLAAAVGTAAQRSEEQSA